MLLNENDSDTASTEAVWIQFICQMAHHLHQAEWIFQNTLLLKPALAAAMPLFLVESYLFSAIQMPCPFFFCGLKSIFTLYAIIFIGSLSNGKITKC